jgi:hypothetical protein
LLLCDTESDLKSYEAVLGSVVQLPLEPVALGRSRDDDTRARPMQLVSRRSQLGLQAGILQCQSRGVTRRSPDRDAPAPVDQRSARDPRICLRRLCA